jgi:MbtH protein
VAVPGGWRTTGKVGSKQECLDYVRSVWTDMRPLSLRRAMSEPKRE